MERKQRSRSRRSPDGVSRRGILLKLGGGAAIAVSLGTGFISTDAFSFVAPTRNSDIGVASDGNGVVGIVGQGPVKKNSRDPMVEFTNNGTKAIDITVTLDTCSDGTLYDNDGDSGCSVTFSLAAGNSQFVDIDADVTGTIPYSISVSGSGFSLDATGSVESESGNVSGAVRIVQPDKDQDFEAKKNQDQWTVKQVDIRDDDGDNDLDRVEFEVSEGSSGGTTVATKTVDTPGDRYKPQDETIQPDDSSYDVQKGQQYTLTVTGYDADGNFATATVQDTAN